MFIAYLLLGFASRSLFLITGVPLALPVKTSPLNLSWQQVEREHVGQKFVDGLYGYDSDLLYVYEVTEFCPAIIATRKRKVTSLFRD
jgi:hypothetical protein